MSRKTLTVKVGSVSLGSKYPIAIQAMTNTDTADIKATTKQIAELVQAGAEIVRVSLNSEKAMQAIPEIISNATVPIIGDFHFNGHVLLTKYPQSAKLLSKYRINPGNVGKKASKDKNFETIINVAIENNKPVRIGANWGSIDQELFQELKQNNAKQKKPKTLQEVMYETMIQSVLLSAQKAQDLGLKKEQIVISAKLSHIPDLVTVNQMLAARCDYVMHIGLTEAGVGLKGVVASAGALSILLNQGIGNTIRVSITPDPKEGRAKEVKVCRELLQSLDFRKFRPTVTSCPGCGRTKSQEYQKLAKDVDEYIEKRMPIWKNKYPGIENLKIAVMGCIVNGPGESAHADIGICLPGTSEDKEYLVFIKGKLLQKLSLPNIDKQFFALIEKHLTIQSYR
jgi:(E)-4-hydroxy-3-methylbut-2-enyl-diphosphate synthase